MAQVNPLTREVLVKIVYYGPGLGGKTTSLSHVHSTAPAETRGQLVSLATPVDRTLYFDFLPVRLATVRGYGVRLQLFTVPGQVYFDQTRRLVLTGADGVVFVADSQSARRDANIESWENLTTNLKAQGRSLSDVPYVLQYNKRDLADVMSVDELDATLNAGGAPAFATSALEGRGVVEALDELVRRVLQDLDARRMFGEPGQALPEVRLSRADVALEEQVSRVTEEIRRPESIRVAEPRQEASPSFSSLFGPDAEDAREVERALAGGRLADAIEGAARLVRAVLQQAAAAAGIDPSNEEMVALLLGVDGDRWLSFRRLLRRVRDGGPVSEHDGLATYAMAIDVRLRSERV